jgi:biopolymer transport protein ExbB
MNSVALDSAPQALGLAHFIAQADAVGKALLVILIAMSAISWYLIAVRGIAMRLRQRRSDRFLAFFWNAATLDEVADEIAVHGAREPFSHLSAHAINAQRHHVRYGAARLAEAGTQQEFLTRTIKKVIDEETARLESGLTTLATIGATAPFVGLFGTVWGVYHALVAIGMSGAGTLDKVAGPVGEALIMTGIGLAVAIPAVIGYNALTRANRMVLAQLDSFAFELLTFLSTGHALKSGAASAPAAVKPLRAAGAALAAEG